jgi:molybdate transport system regulatory protein
MPASKRPHLIRPRLFVGGDLLIGPGKIDLLAAVGATGSISAAARATGVGYKRAWVLLDELRSACGCEVVSTAAGGSRGGGASLTDTGLALIEQYLAIEAACNAAAMPHLQRLGRRLAKGRR